MKTNTKMHWLTLKSAIFILFLILISSTGSAIPVQNASCRESFAYVTNATSVFALDTATNNVTTIMSYEPNYSPDEVAVTPDGKKLYVTNPEVANISVIDTATNTVTATVPVGEWPVGIAITPDGTKVYVANLGNNTTSVIDTATNTVTATIPVGICPIGISVSPDGKKVCVTNHGIYHHVPGNVSVIDTATNKVVDTVDRRIASYRRCCHTGWKKGIRSELLGQQCLCN